MNSCFIYNTRRSLHTHYVGMFLNVHLILRQTPTCQQCIDLHWSVHCQKNTLLHNKRPTNNYRRIETEIMPWIAIAMGKQLPSTHEHYSVPLCVLSHMLYFVQLPNREQQDLPRWHPETSRLQFLLTLDLPREICNTSLNVSTHPWASYYFTVI